MKTGKSATIKHLTIITTFLIAVGDQERREDVQMILPGSDRTLPLVQQMRRRPDQPAEETQASQC